MERLDGTGSELFAGHTDSTHRDTHIMYFEWLAEICYGNPEVDGWIRPANLGLSEYPIPSILDGFVAVVPVPPAAEREE